MVKNDDQKKYDPNRTWYDTRGQEVHVLGQLADGQIVVERLYNPIGAQYEGYGPLDGELAIEVAVFETPPVEAYAEQVEHYREEIKDMKQVLKDLRQEVRGVTDLKKRLDEETTALTERDKELTHLRQFLDGEIKFYVFTGCEYHCPPMILTLKETRSEFGRRQEDLRLLSLFGSGSRRLSWRLNQYSDGSSARWDHVVPCLTHEEARQILIAEYEAEWESLTGKAHLDWVKAADKAGVPVDPKYRERANDTLRTKLRKRLASAKEGTQKIKAELAALA